MAAITLAAMTAIDLEEFIGQEIVDHADQRIREGLWERRDALERSRTELTTIVGWERHAANEADQRLWTAVDADGRRIGWLWVKLCTDPAGIRRAFLCQMTVRSGQRRRGHGRAILAALEEQLARDGYASLSFNVEESNLPAKHLYETAGYGVIRQFPTMRQLSKALPRHEHVGRARDAADPAPTPEVTSGRPGWTSGVAAPAIMSACASSRQSLYDLLT